ncbi:Methionine import ATP-binding protein MetN [compost metagenome]
MDNGEVVEQGTVLDVFSDPKQTITRNFMKTIFDADVPEALLKKSRGQAEGQAKGYVKENGNYGKLLRLSYVGEHAAESMWVDLVTRFALRPHILYGSITQLKNTTIGVLVVRITGEKSAVEAGIRYLSGLDLKIEVIEHDG